MDLLLDLSAARGRRRGIESALRDAVRGGRLVPGATLPSTRSLAADLGVARGTVVAAYAQLVGEGYLAPSADGHVVRSRAVASRPASPAPTRPLVDLHPGEPDPTSFPMAAWLTSLRRAVRDAPPDVLAYGDPRGALELRVALADYLGRARGVVADPDRIVVCSGAVHALRLLAEVVGGRIGMEDPGLHVHRGVVAQTGAAVVPVPVDDLGADPSGLDARAVVLTPAHQFPLGMALDPERRLAFVEWARRTGGLVVEDDYDGELRYDRQPIGALQGLGPDVVAYVGTASKSLGPGLRMAWMVLPDHLVGPVLERLGSWTSVSVLDQLALAELLASHQFERHLRRRRVAYRERRDQLLAALPAEVEVRGLAAGLSALVVLPTVEHERRAMALAAERGVRLFPLGPSWHGEPRLHGLIVGYGRPPAHDLRRSIEVLAGLVGDVLA